MQPLRAGHGLSGSCDRFMFLTGAGRFALIACSRTVLTSPAPLKPVTKPINGRLRQIHRNDGSDSRGCGTHTAECAHTLSG
jgi:hypothetical protein